MSLGRRTFLTGSLAAGLLPGGRARAQPVPTIRIGVLADFSGSYIDLLGAGGVACVRQAVAEFEAREAGFAVEVVFADHQNKADVGAAIVRRWYDTEGVDALIQGPNSAVALAVSFVTREKDKVCLGTAVTSSDFTGAQCTPNSINWTYDAYMLAKATGAETVRSGGRKWYFITTDNAFGNSLQAETARFVQDAGGQVVGNSRYPLGAADYSTYLLAAQSSGADTIGLALGGSDLVNCLKQINEFGLDATMKLPALVMFLNDIHAVGLGTMRGLLHTSSFYWDRDARSRAFTRRVLPRMGGAYPGMTHAGCYAVATHYLKAVAAMGPAAAKRSGAAVVARMKAMPTDDDAFGPAAIRADGRALIPAYLLRVKAPAESRGPWDYCEIIATMDGEAAAKPLAAAGCPLARP
ncbi:hypothetical protein OPKNFCMD_6446 [Methylobacterium crusticola]|uniref:Leucine-binding protein domain-containing protein n=1 Tax=Methylobacterium crusticola TaxID=1697972 RepID=A0ABQ4R8X6_9HYPH|nr:ABC transporter substrate-binding protein [Methylobacterium crusticola]GJD53669.1 hypothetical protein OPKNFCMD_6446 [Methylobacterium crusticola]